MLAAPKSSQTLDDLLSLSSQAVVPDLELNHETKKYLLIMKKFVEVNTTHTGTTGKLTGRTGRDQPALMQ